MTNIKRRGDLSFTLDSEAFEDLRIDFAEVMGVTLRNMVEHNCQDATVSIKLSVSLEKDAAPDLLRGDGKTRPIIVPKISHKIGTQITTKYEQAGEMASYLELVQLNTGEYVMRPVDDGQCSIYDVDPETGELINE